MVKLSRKKNAITLTTLTRLKSTNTTPVQRVRCFSSGGILVYKIQAHCTVSNIKKNEKLRFRAERFGLKMPNQVWIITKTKIKIFVTIIISEKMMMIMTNK